jgi:hypothetical protein
LPVFLRFRAPLHPSSCSGRFPTWAPSHALSNFSSSKLHASLSTTTSGCFQHYWVNLKKYQSTLRLFDLESLLNQEQLELQASIIVAFADAITHSVNHF